MPVRWHVSPHPRVTEYLKGKSMDYDRWLGGMNKFHPEIDSMGRK